MAGGQEAGGTPQVMVEASGRSAAPSLVALVALRREARPGAAAARHPLIQRANAEFSVEPRSNRFPHNQGFGRLASERKSKRLFRLQPLDHDVRALLPGCLDFDLLRFELDGLWSVVRYETSVSQAVRNVLCASREVVRIEEPPSVTCNADNKARWAFFRSRCLCQWLMLNRAFRLGTR